MSGVIVGQKRPRDLAWYHSGPLLFGDWGTSRLYVLGLAFYFTAHASPIYLALMSALMVAVAWAYTIICRCFPDGGGVYAAARQLSPTLSVIGATLLICDYIVTASLSAVEGFHYLGVEGKGPVIGLSILAMVLLGVINWFGSRSAGRFALGIAIVAILMSASIAVMCIPMVGEGFRTITTGHASISDPWTRWENLVRIVLALSGLEAVANMSGLMKPPVPKTAKRTIWPVLIEVIVLNMVFGLAINALPALKPVEMPHYVQYEGGQNTLGPDGTAVKVPSDQIPQEIKAYRDTAMKELARHSATQMTGSERFGQVFAVASGIIFGLLLLSAVNTAIMAMVAVKYAMAHDRELPRPLLKLNYSGVPWIGLMLAVAAPAGLLLIVGPDAKVLAELYAIGVVGAIAINVVSCAVNRKLDVGPWERRGLWVLGAVMSAIFVTIVYAKPNAAVFAGIMITAVLTARTIVQAKRRADERHKLPEPVHGWMAELSQPMLPMDPSKPRVMLAARGRYQAEFAVDMAKRRGATLFAIYVRTLRVLDTGPEATPRLEDDPAAQESLGTIAVLARQYRVPLVPIYICSPNIAEEILDYTVTYGCDTLIMGKTRRGALARSLEGDVVSQVAQHLPDGVALITREATPHPMGPVPIAKEGERPDVRA